MAINARAINREILWGKIKVGMEIWVKISLPWLRSRSGSFAPEWFDLLKRFSLLLDHQKELLIFPVIIQETPQDGSCWTYGAMDVLLITAASAQSDFETLESNISLSMSGSSASFSAASFDQLKGYFTIFYIKAISTSSMLYRRAPLPATWPSQASYLSCGVLAEFPVLRAIGQRAHFPVPRLFATSARHGRSSASLLSSNKPVIPQWHIPYRIRQYSAPCNSSNSIDRHNKRVEEISEKVRGFFHRKEKFRIFHGSTNSTRSALKKNLLDTSSLSHVLEINTEKRTCLVEPNVSMDRLVEATLKYGLVPPVVMEFPGITVGGGYSGTSGESSSFKHGFFDQIINFVEMVLAHGDVVKISPTEKPDLFRGAAGAVGSLGVTTLVELQLHEAKKFVQTTYHPVSGMPEAIRLLQDATANPDLDYVDGIMFSKTSGAVITGRMTNELKEKAPVQCFSGAWDPWFYLHVQDKITKSDSPVTETIPLAEYLFRYDRGGFWVGASAFDYFRFPFNRFTRWWLDDFLHTRMMYTALHASGQSKKYVVQDLALPYATAEAFVNYTDETFGIYPLWLCPLKQNPLPTMHPHSHNYEADGKTLKQMLNIGLWGWGPKKVDAFIEANRSLEHKLRELGGMKWLYAHTYYDEDEFWKMYDKEWYDGLREKFGASSLPSVYEKVKVDVTAEKRTEASGSSMYQSLAKKWPFSGLYGIKRAIESGTYVQARKAEWRSYGKST